MREMFYIVCGKEVKSFQKARQLQPTGDLQIGFRDIIEKPIMSAKRTAYFKSKK